MPTGLPPGLRVMARRGVGHGADPPVRPGAAALATTGWLTYAVARRAGFAVLAFAAFFSFFAGFAQGTALGFGSSMKSGAFGWRFALSFQPSRSASATRSACRSLACWTMEGLTEGFNGGLRGSA